MQIYKIILFYFYLKFVKNAVFDVEKKVAHNPPKIGAEI